MADHHLRLLARRAVQGDPEAESRLLLERVRRGWISVEGLRFAAYLGHGPARAALGERAPRIPEDLLEWATKLRRWGRWNCVHAARAVAARLLERTPDARLRVAFAVAGSWLRCPCVRHTHEARDRIPDRGVDTCALMAPPPWSESTFVRREASDVARALLLVVACGRQSGWQSYGGALLAVAVGALVGEASLSSAEVRRAICVDLLPRVRSRL